MERAVLSCLKDAVIESQGKADSELCVGTVNLTLVMIDVLVQLFVDERSVFIRLPSFESSEARFTSPSNVTGLRLVISQSRSMVPERIPPMRHS